MSEQQEFRDTPLPQQHAPSLLQQLKRPNAQKDELSIPPAHYCRVEELDEVVAQFHRARAPRSDQILL